MKPFLLLVLLAMIAASAIWYGLRIAEQSSVEAVTSLVPKETLFLVQISDLNGARSQWHKTDLYQLWREPAVQDFLQKPLAKIPKRLSPSEGLDEFGRIEPKDIFFAVTAWESDGPQAVGGFRFKGASEGAERIVSTWRANLQRKFPGAKEEEVEYQRHHIQIVTALRQTLATVYDGNWLFVANNVEGLKTVLDRADHRAKERSETLSGDKMFSAALRHMPSSHAMLVYGRADRYWEKIGPLLAASGAFDSTNQSLTYRQIHAFCGTLAFDGGKIRDTLFVGMPLLIDAGPLTRSSLGLGTKETFFYLASFLNVATQMQWPSQATSTSSTPVLLKKIVSAVASSGVTVDDWNTAFGPELGIVGDWPTSVRVPSLLVTLPVRDAAKADQVLTKLTMSTDGSTWTQTDKNGVRYLSTHSPGQLFGFAPTFALSNRILIGGTDEGAVESAVERSASGQSELATSRNFQAAERAVPTAKQAFFYIDSALLYERFDAAIRPLLLMAAAFVPSLNESVDLSKWPAVDVLTKHLSPIVLSQNYQSDGYVTESVGPVTMYQTVIGLMLIAGGAAALYQQQTHGPGIGGWKSFPSPAPLPSRAPAGIPSASPDETP